MKLVLGCFARADWAMPRKGAVPLGSPKRGGGSRPGGRPGSRSAEATTDGQPAGEQLESITLADGTQVWRYTRSICCACLECDLLSGLQPVCDQSRQATAIRCLLARLRSCALVADEVVVS